VRGRDDHSPAYTAESALERAARLARERGGYTVRLDSLRAAQARNHVRTQYEKDSRGHDCDDPDLHGLRHGEHEHHIPPRDNPRRAGRLGIPANGVSESRKSSVAGWPAADNIGCTRSVVLEATNASAIATRQAIANQGRGRLTIAAMSQT
jgi:hypothetical protein